MHYLIKLIPRKRLSPSFFFLPEVRMLQKPSFKSQTGAFKVD